MFLNSNAIGHSPIMGKNPTLDYMSNYNTVEIYGGQTGITIDKVWGRNIPLSLSTIQEYNSENYIPEWIPSNTYMMSEFTDERLEAGNVKGLTEPIMYWNIYRAKINPDGTANNLVFLKRIEQGNTQFIDYTATRENNYKYYLFAETNSQYSQPAISDEILCNYYGYFMIDIENNTVFKIDAAVSGGEQTLNLNFTQYDTNTPYPAFSQGKVRYQSGSVAGLLANQDGSNEYDNPVSLLMAFRDFVYSRNPKYLKTRKGEIFKVYISDYSESVLNQGIGKQPMLSQFNFTEIGKVDDNK